MIKLQDIYKMTADNFQKTLRWTEQNRKLKVVYLLVGCSLVVFFSVIYLARDNIELVIGELFAFWIFLAGWYNESNVRVKALKDNKGAANGEKQL